MLASVHIPILETATGVVGLDGEAHSEVSIRWVVMFSLRGFIFVI